MDPIRVMVVDDESLAREAVKELIQEEPGLKLVGECEDGLQAVEMIPRKKPDVVILDVQMPGFDGFGVLEALRGRNMPLVVFATAYQEYAVKAFESHAVDYLLKPIARERFVDSVQRVRGILNERTKMSYNKKVMQLLDSFPSNASVRHRFIIKNRGRITLVHAKDIDWIEAAGDYVRLHVGNDHFLHHERMNKIEKQLDNHVFARIHRSAIVNLDRIKEMQPLFSGDYSLQLFDGTKLTMSRTHRNKVLGRL